MIIRNRIPARCCVCQAQIAVGAGWSEVNDGRWTSKCQPCSGKVETKPTVRVRMVDGQVMLKLDGFLGGDLFVTFRACIQGARYNMADKSNRMNPQDAPKALQALVDAGFLVDVGTDVKATLMVTQEATKADRMAAGNRAELVDAALQARGLSLYGFQRNGINWLAGRQSALLADDMGLGKAQPVSERVLTISGWVTIGSLKVGDKVIGSDGLPTEVTGVFPQGEKDVFRITLTDGATTRSCKEHLWCVQTPNDRVRGGTKRVHSLEEVMRLGLKDKAGNRKWFVPVAAAVQFEEKELPVHPYLLGALLANGRLSSATAHTGPDAQRAEMKQYLPDGMTYSRADEWTCRIVSDHGEDTKWGRNPLTRSLALLGLQHKLSPAKFIPAIYMLGSVSQRTDLLQGLMDNDGCISADGMVTEYNTTSPQLALDVISLVRSLGGSAWVSTRESKFTYKGEVKVGLTDYRVRMALPFCPFRMSWKAERYVPRSKYPVAHAIDTVVPAGREECVCISVSATDHLYVTEDHILTHNTVQAITALPEGAPVLVVCPAVAKGVWSREIAKWRTDLKVTILNGRGSFRWPSHGHLYVINYDILPSEAELKAAGPAPQGCVVIADEAHVLKGGKKTKRGARFQTLAASARTVGGRTWLLTATPLLNRPQEVWNILAAADLAHSAFGSWSRFVQVFNGTPGDWGGYDWGTPDSNAAAECLRRVSLRRSKVEVLTDLPAKRLSFRTVDLAAQDVKALDAIVAKLGGIENVSEAIRAAIAGRNDALAFTEISRARAILAKAKIPAMMEIIESFEEQGEPLVVFSAHRAPIDMLASRPGWAVITGDTAPEERTVIENRFQNGELLGVACTIKAGGVAITLTRAANSLFIDREWTPALNDQAQDRIYRIGQNRGVCCDHLVANHALDARIAELLDEKTNIVDNSVQASNVSADTNAVTEEAAPDFSAADVAIKAEQDRVAAEQVKANEEALLRLRAAVEREEQEALKPRETEDERKKRVRYEAARARATARGIVVRSDDPERRGAATPAERWAADAVVRLAAADPDGAQFQNDVGFSKADVWTGHWLSQEVQMGLTPAQWRMAVNVCRKYHRQVGVCPGVEVMESEAK